MKTKYSILRALTLLAFVGITILLTSAAMAQAVGDPPASNADALAGVFTALIGALTAKYGWVLTIIAWVGVLRTVIKPIMTAVEAIVKATPGTADDAALERFESGPVWKWIVWCVDWLASVKPASGPTTNPLVKS